MTSLNENTYDLCPGVVAIFHHLTKNALVQVKIFYFWIIEGDSWHVDCHDVGLATRDQFDLKLVRALATHIIHDSLDQFNSELGLVNLNPLVCDARLHEYEHLDFVRSHQTKF